jgi:hypothetical protein
MNDQESNGILTEVQTEEIRNKFLTPAQRLAKEKRDAEAKRKREGRAREKVAKEFASIPTKEELWQHNRKLLPESELNALLEKQDRVWDIVHWVNDVLAGTNLPADDLRFRRRGRSRFVRVRKGERGGNYGDRATRHLLAAADLHGTFSRQRTRQHFCENWISDCSSFT